MKRDFKSAKIGKLVSPDAFAFKRKSSVSIGVYLWLIFLCFSVSAQPGQPKTVRDFFMLLPDKYFGLEPPLTKNEYLERFIVVEDTANGYLEGSGDGAQGGMTMALFKRPDGRYVVGLNTFGEAQDDYRFLEFRNGKWFDVSAQLVPKYSRRNIYKLPRRGTTVEVFAKKVIERGADYELTERGAKLYDLVWSGGKFAVKK